MGIKRSFTKVIHHHLPSKRRKERRWEGRMKGRRWREEKGKEKRRKEQKGEVPSLNENNWKCKPSPPSLTWQSCTLWLMCSLHLRPDTTRRKEHWNQGQRRSLGLAHSIPKINGDDLEMFHAWNKDVVKSSGSVWRTLIIAYSLPVSKWQANFKNRFI